MGGGGAGGKRGGRGRGERERKSLLDKGLYILKVSDPARH